MTSAIFDRQYGVLSKPMGPTQFGNWRGWAWLHYYGQYVLCWSPERFAVGDVLVITKTLNDDWWRTEVEQTRLINGMTDNGGDWIQGQLL